MQPTYLPWIGYFDLMDQADVFVILDDVQFSKQSWHQKNRIKTPNGELMLTVPVIRKFPQLLNEAEINYSQKWLKQHIDSIKCSYSKAKYFNDYFKFLEELYFKNVKKLTELTISIILWQKDALGIKTKIIKSSDINVSGRKVDLVIDICKQVGADEYLSPPGSKEYIDKNNIFKENKINLEYQKYEHPKYSQLWGDFMSYMSAIDLIFNEGDKSLDIIRSGRRK